MIDQVLVFLEQTINQFDYWGQIIWSLIAIVGFWFLRRLLRRTVNKRFATDVKTLYSWRKTIDYVSFVTVILVLVIIWLPKTSDFITFLGLLAAGLAVALRDPIVNLAGWVFILWRKPFTVGDRIQIGKDSGDVVDIGLFNFRLIEVAGRIEAEQRTGRIIHQPNGQIFTNTYTNFDQGLPVIWNEIPVCITFESDWQLTKSILYEIVESNAPELTKEIEEIEKKRDQRYLVTIEVDAPVVYTSVNDFGVVLTMRYLIMPKQRRDTEQDIWEALLKAFSKHNNIDLAYPTYRYYLDPGNNVPGLPQ